MTVWPARRSAKGLLCGRKVDGRYVCQGLIALVLHDPAEPSLGSRAVLPPGMTEDPPASGFWRPTTRATKRLSEGRKDMTQRRKAFEYTAMPGPFDENLKAPWRRACPHCGAIAVVTEAVISS
jgi:hypothetical protein